LEVGVVSQEGAAAGGPAPAVRADGHRPQAAAPAEQGLVLRDIRRQYGSVVAVDSVNLTVGVNARVAIVGPSGCGKSTILSVVSGLEEPDEGSIEVLGASARQARLSQCAWMPQRDLLLPWRTVIGNVCLPLENRGMGKKPARQQVEPLFQRFGLGGFEDKRPSQLSGGMRQRASFLRTLVADKSVMLLDEPFGALDSITRGDIQLWLLRALDEEPRTVLMVTHDVDEAVLVADEVVVMSPRPGRIIAHIDSTLPAFTNRREAMSMPAFLKARDEVMAALEAA
jgi:ABC-type nitrate/sulfonate/bicarbonate transport system ATPase subunit